MMTVEKPYIKLYATEFGTHVHIKWFSGDNPDTRALCGVLRLRTQHEWDALRDVAEREGWEVDYK